MDRTYISGIENGSFNATIDVLDKLARALDIDVQKLLEVPPEGSQRPSNQPAGRKRS